MPRNFDRRYELMFPVADPVARQAVLDNLRAQLRDDVNAFALEANGTEKPRWGGDLDCQRPDARRLLEPHIIGDRPELGGEGAGQDARRETT
jgi:polyphosphate kinase